MLYKRYFSKRHEARDHLLSNYTPSSSEVQSSVSTSKRPVLEPIVEDLEEDDDTVVGDFEQTVPFNDVPMFTVVTALVDD